MEEPVVKRHIIQTCSNGVKISPQIFEVKQLLYNWAEKGNVM